MCNSIISKKQCTYLSLKRVLLEKQCLQTCSREGNGTRFQYSCLENPMDGGAWWAAIHGVAKSGTRLSDFTFTFHFHALEKEIATHSSVLAWRIQGWGSLVGYHLWGRTESDTTEATWQQQTCSTQGFHKPSIWKENAMSENRSNVKHSKTRSCLSVGNTRCYLWKYIS